VGGHLLAQLQAQGGRVFGLVRPSSAPLAGCEVVVADLLDAEAVARVVRTLAPQRIVHLAAQSSVKESWADPEATLKTNVLGLLHLLEGVRKAGLRPRVLVVGSADEYGAVADAARPLGEDAPLRPVSPYAVSKVAQGYLALQYALGHGLSVVRTRTFNHTGPGRGAVFAESSFARQIADIEAGRREPRILVGNLEAVRDFSDVRDVVRAYALLAERGAPGEVYNVCSGRGVRLRELLDELLGLARIPLEVRLDPARLRPSDVPALVGDPSRLRRSTGWSPRHTLAEALRDLLEAWRARVGAGEGEARR
jgi:GDP-4-dehydro-6-deoxy-D-mannose reductase